MLRIIRTGVYRITNLMTGDTYIGSSVDIENRWKSHRRNYNTGKMKTVSLVYSAWKKYGEEAFLFEIVEECSIPYDHVRAKTDTSYKKQYVATVLLPLEQHYLDTETPAYNILKIAGSRLGSKMPADWNEKMKPHRGYWKGKKLYPEMIEAIRQRNTGRKMSDEARKNQSLGHGRGEANALYGIPRSDETKAKISDALTGRPYNGHGFEPGAAPWNKGVQTGIAPWQGKTRSPETVDKIRQANTGRTAWNKGMVGYGAGRKATPEARENMRRAQKGHKSWNKGIKTGVAPMLGKKHRAETIEKMRQAQIGRPSARKGTKITEETREKMRAAKREYWINRKTKETE